MAFGLWRKPHTVRRYGPSEPQDGLLVPSDVADMVIEMDVQVGKCETVTDEDGEHSLQKLEVFSDEEIRAVNGQTMADKLWYHGKWYECRSAILLENTILSHYECEFIQCWHQEAPPSEKQELSGEEVPDDNK